MKTSPSPSKHLLDHRHSFLQQTAPPSPPSSIIGPPSKGAIRYIENDPQHRREKYDGHRWRLVCTWSESQCINLAYSYHLCPRHNAQRQNKPLKKSHKKPTVLTSTTSVSTVSPSSTNEDDDIEFIGVFYPNKTIDGSRPIPVKGESSHFEQFSIDSLNVNGSLLSTKPEPRASTSSNVTPSTDIQFVGSKTPVHPVNVTELIVKNIPPLTEFEEEFLGALLISNCSPVCSMLDAQIYLHNEAMTIVQRNYRLKMDTIAPEYFYDFLLRHPRIALHFRHWFEKTKPVPPTNQSPMDTKIWTLGMMVRGSTLMEASTDD